MGFSDLIPLQYKEHRLKWLTKIYCKFTENILIHVCQLLPSININNNNIVPTCNQKFKICRTLMHSRENNKNPLKWMFRLVQLICYS